MPTPTTRNDQGSPEPAAFVPAHPAAGSAKTWRLLAEEAGTLDPLIAALARASDRVGPAQTAGRRPSAAS
jgi:hypothetical protein